MKYQSKQLSLLLLAVTMLACNYSFQAGSFPPPHVQSIAVLPFDNETNRFELPGELYDQLVRNLPSALGIRTAGEEVADAVVRGSIRTYEVRAPNYRAAIQGQPAEVLQRQVNIVVSVPRQKESGSDFLVLFDLAGLTPRREHLALEQPLLLAWAYTL